LIADLRHIAREVEETRGKAMFEISTEVVCGLVKAFTDYERKNKPAWQKERVDD
jgi:hypothetical protein